MARFQPGCAFSVDQGQNNNALSLINQGIFQVLHLVGISCFSTFFIEIRSLKGEINFVG